MLIVRETVVAHLLINHHVMFASVHVQDHALVRVRIHVVHVPPAVVLVQPALAFALAAALADVTEAVIAAVTAIQVVMVLVLVLVIIHVLGSVLHAMDVLTVAVATERVLLVVTHPAMRAHIQWCESPEKERSGSLSRGGRVPDFYG